jgi:glycine/D-amino acid oxidase-like deaminating enzyme
MTISTTPFWQAADSAAVRPAAEPPGGSLPARTDALIIGAGFTGLTAARETAAAGADTWVFEAGAIGTGCSGRNGGQVAYSIKPTYEALSARHGTKRAFAICREGLEAVEQLRALAANEEPDLDWRQNGCFFGAHTPRHFTAMARAAHNQPRGLEQRISIIPRAEQHAEIASDFYHGGCVYHDDASVDPMRMLRALERRARRAGAVLVEHCPVLALDRCRGGFKVRTTRGVIEARRVLIATNGYTGALTPWQRRRVIPIGSYQIATAPLGAGVVRRLIPHLRNVVDSRRVVVYFRPSPDGERIIFGGRAALAEKDPLVCVRRLKAMLAQILPELSQVGIDHAWVGFVAYTFDTLPHVGHHDGLYHCMGYCGQGVPLAPYYGRKIGLQMAGRDEGATALDGLPFATRPWYRGTPWFLAPSVLAFRALDALGL